MDGFEFKYILRSGGGSREYLHPMTLVFCVKYKPSKWKSHGALLEPQLNVEAVLSFNFAYGMFSYTEDSNFYVIALRFHGMPWKSLPPYGSLKQTKRNKQTKQKQGSALCADINDIQDVYC